MANFNDKLIVLENMPEVLEELEVTDDVVSMADDDDMSTVMGDGDDEENVEKQMMKEEGGNAFTAIGEEDDLANIVFQGHTDSVYCADINEIHPGMVISGGGDDKAFIWQFPVSSDLVESNEQVGVSNCIALEGHTDTVTSVGFNFDATLALTASYDGTVRIWNVDTGELIHILDGPEEIEWACWHSKGNAVIAGSRDGTIWMWLAHNGQCLQVFAGHEGCVSAGDFTIDGKYIVTGGEDGSVRVWAPKTGQCKHIFEGAHESLVTCLATSKKDPDVILSGSTDGTVRLLHIAHKRILQEFIHSRAADERMDTSDGAGEGEDEACLIDAMAVECCGICHTNLPFIASGGMDAQLKIWDLNSGSLRISCVHAAAVVSLQWHTSMPIVTTGSLDNQVRIWDARNGDLIVALTGHCSNVTFVCSSSFQLVNNDGCDEREIYGIVSVSDDATVRFFATDLRRIMTS